MVANRIETDCTITHEGRSYTNLGAVISDEYLICYLGQKGTAALHHGAVTDWHGAKIGVYRIDSKWRAGFDRYGTSWCTMHAVTVWLTDGRCYKGRSQGEGMIFKGRRAASQRTNTTTKLED